LKKRTILLASLFAAHVILSGCTYGGAFASVHQTNVELSDNTFKIVATDVKGEASSAHILGGSFLQVFIPNR
jgi:uncharacterized protein DUF6567